MAARLKRPEVTVKLAVDRNGAVDDLKIAPERFTCSEALDKVHRIRLASDCVIVGVNTIIRDDAQLTVRRVPLAPGQSQPLRVVLDPSLRIPKDAQVLTDEYSTVVFCASATDDPLLALNPPPSRRGDLVAPPAFASSRPTLKTKSGVSVDRVWLDEIEEMMEGDQQKRKRWEALFGGQSPPSKILRLIPPATGQFARADRRIGLDLRALLDHLGRDFGVKHAMVEAGPRLVDSFLTQGLVDRLVVVRATSVEFQGQPLPSHVTAATLQRAGLQQVARGVWGADEVTYWSRKGIPWPTDDPASWP
ncbi:unnamed protein product [Vitrella brassicaformis CCMP3155]|uniref:Bacterial bifunctional deaminase-reductase C-terminal domain-containing protein n=2 Tax=Vitrella brassicaformis TaxID=1169539 RepID=A0A0G4F4C9_VITBC|nr:unnamed protein product [Vitrella brassicaformis CCMP3155]|eukprot:CEM06899.1 unnamed protein product [Vitrella brassicaformis CCMP3155]